MAGFFISGKMAKSDACARRNEYLRIIRIDTYAALPVIWNNRPDCRICRDGGVPVIYRVRNSLQ